MQPLDRDILFTALTRPQTLMGVHYGFVVLNGVICAELFLIFKSFWVILAAGLIHLTGWVMTIKDPHIFDLWLTKVLQCPRVPNYRFWQCNSYQP